MADKGKRNRTANQRQDGEEQGDGVTQRQTRGVLDPRNAIALHFADKENSDQAVGIILREVPTHTFFFPDRYTIIMDRADECLFAELLYESHEVAHPDEVSDEEMAHLRHKNLFGEE